jgi:hypothetical protein
LNRRRTALPEPPPGPLGKLVALIAGATLLVLGFMFSIVLLAVVAAVGLCVWIYLWWKTRELRRVLREQQATRPVDPEAAATDGQIIEGEAIVVEERDPDQDRSPGHDR